MEKYRAVYQCSRCGMYLGVDIEPVDTGRGKEVFVQQTIVHDCPHGGIGKAMFLRMVDTKEGLLG